MKQVALVMCNNMHMDIEKANQLLNVISNNDAYQIASDYTEADIVIVFTCAFGPGKDYSMYVIADVQNNAKQPATIIVTGCLVNLNQKELEVIPGICVKRFEEVMQMFGTLPDNCEPLLPQNKVIISEGCLKRCAYCVYPQIAGKYKSKPIENVLTEVSKMVDKENTIYITGALETSDYGVDLYGSSRLAELIDKICTEYPDCNYVLGWFHPVGLTDEVLSVIAKHKNIVEVMVHIQHVKDKILKDMNRPPHEFTDSRLKKLKELRPDLMISSEVIVGFPGETEEDFAELINYLDSGLFSDIGVASYEPVLGTKASILPNAVPVNVKKERLEFIKTRYNACPYPAPEKPATPILGTYIEACNAFEKSPKMVLNAASRQEYELIAGVDTRFKMPAEFSKLLQEQFTQILEARDSVAIRNLKSNLQGYTDDYKKFLKQVFELSNLKPAIQERIKKVF